MTTHGYGYGADSVAIGITLTAIASALLAGKKVEENLDAWLRLGRRLQDALRRLRKRGVKVAVSQPAATALVLAKLADDTPDLASIELLNVTVAAIENRSLTPAAAASFLEHPDRYYIFTVRRDGSRLDVICMSAVGQVVFQQSVSLSHFAYGSF